jgi:hypothetical protein
MVDVHMESLRCSLQMDRKNSPNPSSEFQPVRIDPVVFPNKLYSVSVFPQNLKAKPNFKTECVPF